MKKIDRKGIFRFFKYSSVGVGTFLVDLALLYVFIDWLSVPYLLATIIAFLIAVSMNFLISSHVVFKGFSRSMWHAYVQFMTAATFAIFIITVGMYIAVELIGIHYLVARVAIAGVVGFLNYLFNLYATFQVSGKHL